jgi:hypothetical protein
MVLDVVLSRVEEGLVDLSLLVRYFDLSDLEFLGFSPDA